MKSIYLENLKQALLQSNIVQVFDNLLTFAVESDASDIHIEPYENFGRIRIRIDWILTEIVQYPKTIHDNIIAKFKIESGQMKPDEKRLPQDARVSSITLTSKELDLRANTLPTVRGEKLVMRIVDKSKKVPLLESLGIQWVNYEAILRNIHYPNGIILNTGPTGCGKSTTLYACLHLLNKTEKNILTYEDPVENKMYGLNQSQIRWDIGYTFAQWLRASLRQDPDIVMVGEIRDWETLETAMEASMTWHLVFSTVHTNNSAETITRVMNLWAKSYQICGTFNLVMAQRLVRMICHDCKVKESNPTNTYSNYVNDSLKSMDSNALAQELKKRNLTMDQVQTLYAGTMCVGKGTYADGSVCKTCWGTGYRSRVWLYEVMEYDDELRNMLLQDKTAFEIEKHMLNKGMINLERDGIFKVIQGLTTLEEVYRTTRHK